MLTFPSWPSWFQQRLTWTHTVVVVKRIFILRLYLRSQRHNHFLLSTDVCSIQCGGSICCTYRPTSNKRRLTNLAVHSIYHHHILLVQVYPQLHRIFSAAAILASADLAIPLCTRGRVLGDCRDSLFLSALQNYFLSARGPLPALCSHWSCVYYWRRVRTHRAPTMSVVGLPGSIWRSGFERQDKRSTLIEN